MTYGSALDPLSSALRSHDSLCGAPTGYHDPRTEFPKVTGHPPSVRKGRASGGAAPYFLEPCHLRERPMGLAALAGALRRRRIAWPFAQIP